MSDPIRLKRSPSATTGKPADTATVPALNTSPHSAPPVTTVPLVTAPTLVEPQSTVEERSPESTVQPTLQRFPGHSFGNIAVTRATAANPPANPAQRQASTPVYWVQRSPNVTSQKAPPLHGTRGFSFGNIAVRGTYQETAPQTSALQPQVQRQCAACEQKDELLMRQNIPTPLQREASENPPAEAPQAAAMDGAGKGSESDEQMRAIAQQLEQQLGQHLVPETIQAALGQIDLSGMPISDNAPNAGDSGSSATNVYTKRANGGGDRPSKPILRQSAPQQPDPPSTAGSSSATPQTGSAGTFVSALVAVPEIRSGLATLQTLTMGRFAQDWSRLRTGEQIGLVSTTVVIGAGTLTGILANPESRRFALDQLNGKVLPVPGVPWLRLELNTGGNNLMMGMHVDVGRFLPPMWGFGPSSPSAIGGPPQPEPLPGQRMIQRQEEGAGEGATGDIAQRIQSASGSGGKLDEGVQQHLEQHLGADLSDVRVHTDSEADRLSRSVNAVAFTTGQDIFFSSGSYNPTSTQGQHLIAHEVVHTIQQRSGAVAGTPTAEGVSISDPSDSFEQEAEQVADQIVQTPEPQIPGEQPRKTSASSRSWFESLLEDRPVQRSLLATNATPVQIQRNAKNEIIIQRSLVDDVFSYLRTGNAIADFCLGVVAGVLEWIENLIRGVISLAAGLLELLAEADRGNIWASLGVIGLIVVIILACAFPEVSVPILVALGITVGILHLAYHIAMLFNPLISAYDKGKHLGKALIEAALIVVSVLEILQFAKAFRTISQLTEGAGAMQKIRWFMQIRRFGSLEASLAVLEEVKDVEKAIQLIEVAKNSERALELIRAERNIDTLLDILRIEGMTAEKALQLLGKPGMTGAILKNFLRNPDGGARMSLTDLDRLLGHSKISENVALLQNLINHAKVKNFGQLEELLNNSKISTSVELQQLLNNSKVGTAAELQSLLNSTKVTTLAELESLLSSTKITSAAELQGLLNNIKITSAAELQSLLECSGTVNASQLSQMLSEVSSAELLINLFRQLADSNPAHLPNLLRQIKNFGLGPEDLLKILEDAKVARQTGVPLGIAEELFAQAAQRIRPLLAEMPYGNEIVVQGSRVRGYSMDMVDSVLQPVLKRISPDATTDLDIAVRVSEEGFATALERSFGTPNPESAKARTMQQAMDDGRIFGGDARPNLRAIRRTIAETMNMTEDKVQVTVVKIGGKFDSPPNIPFP